MNRPVYALVVAALFVTAGIRVSSAEPPGEAADVFQGVSVSITRTDRLWIACGFPEERDAVGYFAFSVDASDGTHLDDGYQVFSEIDGAAVRVGDTAMRHEMPYTTPTGGEWTFFRVPRHVRDATLRVAWSSWRTAMRCNVFVNNVKVEPQDLPVARAAYATVSDLSGGLAVAAGVDFRDLATVAADGRFVRQSEGFLLGLMHVGGQVARAQMHAEGPEGQSVSGSSSEPVRIHEPTSGSWTYELQHQLSILADGPLLFLMELR